MAGTTGILGLVLTLEDQAPIQSPTLRQIEAAAASLTPRGGPGFLILDSQDIEDYSQAAGGDGKYTVEWREYSKGDFTHWVAGLRGGESDRTIELETNGCVVTVRSNEVLALNDVQLILTESAQRKGRPAEYAWRDMTEQFRK